jgi:exodeoxyribonuclease VII small subunit
MSDESYSFSTARARLEEIVTQVRKKDTSLEKSLDLLEEGVRLASTCTELIDHADWTVGGVGESDEGAEAGDSEQPEHGDDEGPGEAPGDEESAADDDELGDVADDASADAVPKDRDDEA